jgi:hypothetical protein|tara:strand:- start:324 stop:746 length:423 start_codon:yes stop_codon:yes gene_type:complete
MDNLERIQAEKQLREDQKNTSTIQAQVDNQLEWLNGNYRAYLLKNRLPQMSADDLMTFLIECETVIKIYNSDEYCKRFKVKREDMQYDLGRLAKSHTGEVIWPNFMRIKDYNSQEDFKRSLKRHKKWINNFINIYNIINV